MSFDLKKIKKVHFVGVGGIGISAIARMMLLEGKNISGSDIAESEVTKDLQKQGIKFSLGQKVEDIPSGTEIIIYSNAIKSAHSPFLSELEKTDKLLLSYPEALAIISQNKKTIAIAGTHGKTTTTAMIGTILKDAGFDPTIIVGGQLKREKSNMVLGKSNFLVVEADEYRRAFLNLSPSILVITNIDADHLDYYKDLADIENAFKELSEKVGDEGYVICNATHPHISPVISGLKARVIDYSKIENIPPLRFPGAHNIQNAQAALALAEVLSVNPDSARKSLIDFEGTERRFEYKGETDKGVLVYDDYAHNPQKVRAALQGARQKYPDNKIFAVFQPHLFSRTKLLLMEFAESFRDADEVVILPIYAAREIDDGSVSNEDLAKEIQNYQKNVRAIDFDKAVEFLKNNSSAGDVIITLGAGEAYRTTTPLLGDS